MRSHIQTASSISLDSLFCRMNGSVCYGCGQTGHFRRDCPTGGGGGGGRGTKSGSANFGGGGGSAGGCWTCGDPSHVRANCRAGRTVSAANDRPSWGRNGASSGGSGSRACFICSSTEHIARDCPHGRGVGDYSNFGGRVARDNDDAEGGANNGGGGGGGDGACFLCGDTSHWARSCPNRAREHDNSRQRPTDDSDSAPDTVVEEQESVAQPFKAGRCMRCLKQPATLEIQPCKHTCLCVACAPFYLPGFSQTKTAPNPDEKTTASTPPATSNVPESDAKPVVPEMITLPVKMVAKTGGPTKGTPPAGKCPICRHPIVSLC